jgi:RNA polymerase sigma-70 factor (ECF subfamily)
VDSQLRNQFELLVLPHLDAAFNLARWLTGNERDAEDVTQEASMRALKFFSGFRGENARSWFLTIVRRTTWNWLQRNRGQREETEFDEELHGGEDLSTNPETILNRQADIEAVRTAIAGLPPEFREAVILRELEGCAYKEISDITGAPLGTVMSRLARARRLLQTALSSHASSGGNQ